MAFTIENKAGYYECDPSFNLKLSACVRNMQKIANEHIDHLGFSTDEVYHKNRMVFLLAKTCIKVNRMPRGNEIYDIMTMPLTPKGAKFIREAALVDKNGQPLVWFLTYSMLVNVDSKKILRPSDFPFVIEFGESILGDNLVDRRIPHVNESQLTGTSQIFVGYSLLDNNGHVNNSYYIDFVCDLLDHTQLIEKGIDTLNIVYSNEAVHGDIIKIRKYQTDKKAFQFVATIGEDNPCFEATVTLK